MQNHAWKRFVLVCVLGVFTGTALAGLGVVVYQSRSHSNAEVRNAAHQRATLAADLIDSALASPADKAPRSAPRDSKPMAVFAPGGQLVTARRSFTAGQLRQIASDPALAAAFRDHSRHLSNLVAAIGGQPAGFMDVSPYVTPQGPRARVTLMPISSLGAAMDRYLAYVAHSTTRSDSAQAYLLDGDGDVLASSSPAAAVGRPLQDGALLTALARDGQSGDYGGSQFFTAAPLTVAPWRIVYTVPASALYEGPGTAWGLSLTLLASFAAVAVICLILMIRLLSRTDQLARANQTLGERNDELQAATEAKSRFVANLSHELRNPLNAVIGFAELLHNGRVGRLSERQREHLSIIRGSGEHLVSLIDDALDLARIEAGHVRLAPAPTQPAVIADACVTSLAMMSAAKAITVEVHSRSVGIAMLDQNRLRQVIVNYLSNAIKFSPKAGRVAVGLKHERDGLLIEVSDTGPGIDPLDQSRIFEEFVQLPGRDRSGSGLGLAVSKLIVEAQGGQVGVRSIAGHGSTFWAWLPTTFVQAGPAGVEPTVPVPAAQQDGVEPTAPVPAGTQDDVEPTAPVPAGAVDGTDPAGTTAVSESPDPFDTGSHPAPPQRTGGRAGRRPDLARR